MNVHTSSYERIANRLTIFLFLLLVGLSVTAAFWLPDPIPTHFNGNGQADRWSSPTMLLQLPLIGGCMIGLFWAIRHYTPTSLMNIPGPRTPENLARQRQNFDQLMATMQVLITGLFLGITSQIIWVSTHHSKQIVPWPSFLFIALICISMLISLIRAYKLAALRK